MSRIVFSGAGRVHNGLVQPADLPADEASRLAELRSLSLLDSEPEERFDRVTRLAQRLFDVPIALVSLVDADRQWFKSRQGLSASETPREMSFCAHALHDDDVLHVPDARLDPRFVGNPLVDDDPHIRFYAGYPITGPGGSKLGTLCIIDRQPRALSDSDAACLRDLAGMVEREIAAVHLAVSDELTGLSNRRGFEVVGTKVIDVCKRRGVPAALLFLDLDELKPINDRFGHDEGDRVLRDFARLLEETFRASDVIARLGGDEFAVLLSGTEATDDAAARLHACLHENQPEFAHQYRLSVSVGRANFDPAAPVSLDALIQQEDIAMYQEKSAKKADRPG